MKAIHELASETARAQNAGWRLRHTILDILFVPFLLLVAKSNLVPVKRIERAILVNCGHEVLLDADLAALYGVETR